MPGGVGLLRFYDSFERLWKPLGGGFPWGRVAAIWLVTFSAAALNRYKDETDGSRIAIGRKDS